MCLAIVMSPEGIAVLVKFVFQIDDGFVGSGCDRFRGSSYGVVVAVVKSVLDDLVLNYVHFLNNLIPQIVNRSLNLGVQFDILSVHFVPDRMNVLLQVIF